METKTTTWCANNTTRGCTLSSKVTVADSAREPLKVLKVLIEGLGRDSESSLWLTPLLYAPQLTRLFPFDLAYLDGDNKVIRGVALLPGVQIPEFTDETASALILPLATLATTKTQPGDHLMICAAEELESRLAEMSAATVVAAVTPPADAEIAVTSLPFTAPSKLPLHPFPDPRVAAPTLGTSVTQGTGFTVSLTTTWQISNSTMAALLPEPVKTQEAAQEEESTSGSYVVQDIAVADAESEEAQEETIPTCAASESESVSGTISDQAAPARVAESAQEESATASAPPIAAEPEEVAAELETIGTEQEAVAVELDEVGVELKTVSTEPGVGAVEPEAAEGCGPADNPKIDVSGALSETAPVVESAKAQADAHVIPTGTAIPQGNEPAKSLPAAIAVSTDADPITLKKKSADKKKEPREALGTRVKRWLNCPDPLPERRSIIRLLSRELVAYSANDEKAEPYEVRDVSPTGLYLCTEERWNPGDLVSLVLQRKDATEKDHEKRASVEVRAVRLDVGGVGLSWVWPEGVEFQPWSRVHTKRWGETDADYFLRELRLARALGFLRQICLPAAEETSLALHRRLSNKRVASAIEIALKAQVLFGRVPGPDVLAHPDMVRRILENGSWTDDDWIRQWWAGLLVSSCCADALDTSNSVFIDLLAKLTPVHLRVLSFVCRKATELIAAGEPAATLDVYCTSEELIEAVGSHSLARIQQTLGQLSSLGLVAENNKPSYVAITDKVKTRTLPTPLALEMYARCNGRR